MPSAELYIDKHTKNSTYTWDITMCVSLMQLRVCVHMSVSVCAKPTALHWNWCSLQWDHFSVGLWDVNPKHNTNPSVFPSNICLSFPQLDVRVPQLQDSSTINTEKHSKKKTSEKSIINNFISQHSLLLGFMFFHWNDKWLIAISHNGGICTLFNNKSCIFQGYLRFLKLKLSVYWNKIKYCLKA